MKKWFVLAFYLLMGLPLFAQTPSLRFITDFETQGEPLAIAADGNGGLYYTVFTFSGPNLTRCYYIADPVNANALENHILVDDAAESEVPAGRGFTGVAVDNAGNVYLALEIGNNTDATVRKLSPAPGFEPVEAFFGGIVFGNKRFNGIDIFDEETLILSTFGEVEFWDANDSTPLHTVSGGESFQRDLAFNPNTGDIYIAKNRNVNGEPISSANLLPFPGIDDIFSYAGIEPNFIPQGGAGGDFGINAQLIEYDPVNDWILIPDHSQEQSTLAIYSPQDSAAPLRQLDGSESENGAMDTPADAVSIQDPDGNTWVFITDSGSSRIYVYSTLENAGIMNWELIP